jgi:hypothetical protein
MQAAIGSLAWPLASCGGSGGDLWASPGVGTGGTGFMGTITGLGSVYVDGVRLDESKASLEQEQDLKNTSALIPSSLQIGQRVEIETAADGSVSRVRLGAQLAGPVGQVSLQQQSLLVFGQTVVVNLDPAQGPVTVFSGYAGLAEVAVGDAVRVYGSPMPDPQQTGQDRLQAHRIEYLDRQALPPARLSGVLQASGPTGWSLAGVPVQLAQAQWLPVGASAQAGLRMTAVGPWPASALAVWTPDTVKVQQLPSSNSVQRVSGPVRVLANRQLEVGGVSIDASAPALAQTVAALQTGQYLSVSGVPTAGGAQLLASSLETLPDGGRPVELRGAIESWLGLASFSVRGQMVDASKARLSGTSALGNGRYVEITGRLNGNVLSALELNVPDSLPDQAVLSVSGQVQSLDTLLGRLEVKLPTGEVKKVASSKAAGLKVGDSVEVEGYWQSGLLQALQVEVRSELEQDKQSLKGVVEAVANDRFRFNGLWIMASAAQLPALRKLRGELVEIVVQQNEGQWQFIGLHD